MSMALICGVELVLEAKDWVLLDVSDDAEVTFSFRRFVVWP